MPTILERRTAAQGEAILAGIKYLRGIKEINFSMGITLWHMEELGPIKRSTICGCLAGNLLLAKARGKIIRELDWRNAGVNAANLIGITKRQRVKLFQPVHKWAHCQASTKASPDHITKYHATLVLAYFYFTGIIEWKKEKVYQWLFDNDKNNISGVFK